MATESGSALLHHIHSRKLPCQTKLKCELILEATFLLDALSMGGVIGVNVWNRHAGFQSQASEWKAREFPRAAGALSQHRNEPRGQSPLGPLAPRNLAARLAEPPGLGDEDRESTPDNHRAQEAAQTVLENEAMRHSYDTCDSDAASDFFFK